MNLIHEIREINPQVQLMLSPWSPPAWMKTNGSLLNGSLKPEYFDVFARYLVRAVQAYEADGLPVAMVTPQNEPFYGNDIYPSMYMNTDDQISFIRDHLGPKLRQAGLSTKILGLDHNFIYRADAERIWNEAREFVTGIAYHCYEGEIDLIKGVTTPVYQTECTAIENGTKFSDTLHFWLQTQIIDGGLVGTKMALGWNLVLDEEHGPRLEGACSNCRGMFDVDTKLQTYKINAEMVAISHAGKFVQRGAYRIDTKDYDSPEFNYIGYRNPSGSVILIVENKSNKSKSFIVPDNEGRSHRLTLPALGVATVAIAPAREEEDSTPAVASDPSSSEELQKIALEQ